MGKAWTTGHRYRVWSTTDWASVWNAVTQSYCNLVYTHIDSKRATLLQVCLKSPKIVCVVYFSGFLLSPNTTQSKWWFTNFNYVILGLLAQLRMSANWLLYLLTNEICLFVCLFVYFSRARQCHHDISSWLDSMPIMSCHVLINLLNYFYNFIVVKGRNKLEV